MNNKILQIFFNASNRYLQDEEKKMFLGYANSVAKRLQVAEEVEEKESQAIDSCIEELKKKYPSLSNHYDSAWEKAFRDIQLVLRSDVHAMLQDDILYVEQKTLIWLRTILASFDMTPQLLRDTYTFLLEKMRESLTPESFQMMLPYLEKNIEVLSDFPEPENPKF